MKLPLQAHGSILSLAPKPFLEGGIKDSDGKKTRPLDAVEPDGRMAKRKAQIDPIFIFSCPVSLRQVNGTGNSYGVFEFQ